jgi:hypothetical protein
MVNRLEIHRRQIHGGKSRAADDVGHRLARVGEEYVRAGGRKERFEIGFRHVADLENAGLRHLHQKHGLLARLGGHRDRQHHLVQALADGRAFIMQLHVHLRLLARQEYVRGMRNLQRQVLDVNLLDAEYRLLLRFVHLGSIG